MLADIGFAFSAGVVIIVAQRVATKAPVVLVMAGSASTAQPLPSLRIDPTILSSTASCATAAQCSR